MRRRRRRVVTKPSPTQHWELRFGVATAGSVPFRSADDRRRAWEAHHHELLSDCGPGRRPAAFWEYDAQRPQHLTAYPDRRDFDSAEAYGRAVDEHEHEPILYLAREGHLRAEEIEEIRGRAAKAAARVGTGREQMQSAAISKDRSVVRLAQAVDQALGEPVAEAYAVETPYG